MKWFAVLLASMALACGQNWKFVVVGDTRGPSASDPVNLTIMREIGSQITNVRPAFVLVPGDLAYTGSLTNFQRFKAGFAAVYSAGIPVYPVLGNHDANDVTSYRTVFGSDVPDNGPAAEKDRTYFFNYQNALIVGLDVYVSLNRINQSWLNAVLATNKAPHVFTFAHSPAFKVNHADCLDDYPTNRDAFWNSLRSVGSRIYWCGHDHFYDRLRLADTDGIPENEVYQIISGAGGAPTTTSYDYNGNNTTWTPIALSHSASYGYNLVQIDGRAVTVSYWRRVAAGSYSEMDKWSYRLPDLVPVVPSLRLAQRL